MQLTRSQQFAALNDDQQAGFAISTLNDFIGIAFDDLMQCPPILFSLINPTTIKRMDQTRFDELDLVYWAYLRQDCLGSLPTQYLSKVLERSKNESVPEELLFLNEAGKLEYKKIEPLDQRLERAIKTAKRNEKESRIKHEFRCRDLTECKKMNVISLTHLAARLDLDASTIRKSEHLRLRPISGSRNGRKQCYFIYTDVLAYINSIYVPADSEEQLGDDFPLLYRLCSLAIRHKSVYPMNRVRREIKRTQSYYQFSSRLILVTEEAYLNAIAILELRDVKIPAFRPA